MDTTELKKHYIMAIYYSILLHKYTAEQMKGIIYKLK